jgi:outer membrane protein TolC
MMKPKCEKSYHARSTPHSILHFAKAVFLMLAVAAALGACGSLHLNPDPELEPAGNFDRVWIPPASIEHANEAAFHVLGHGLDGNVAQGALYDLPALVDLALRTNPQTQHAWYAAQAADAQLGQAEAANYPNIAGEGTGGYLKLPIQFPGQTLVIRNEAFLPQFKVTYDLLDFGRTRAAEKAGREQLIAANFAFDRAIQDVVFGVEKAYYVLSAAKASVRAAEANLKLAQTSFGAVQERHRMGLATGPQLLLAKQVEAQAIYALENARAMVHDAESGLCEAVGIASDAAINVQSIDHQKVPASLSNDVESLIDRAIKRRPDIAAQIAAVRAGAAAVSQARAEFYPEVELSGNYGQIIWNYTVNGGPNQSLNQPFYGALIALRWNLFTGFGRYYGERKAAADRNSAETDLRSLRLSVVAAVWTAYYDFFSARKKYDAAQTLVAASEEAYNANLESHRHGLATVTDLIGAERDLMAARFTLVQDKAELLVSSAALVHAVGAEYASSAP